ncbi:MAG: hypothetical protein KA131_07700, partial [Thauera sp.]|nr:hypothetical protein [Thauera sp.]
MSKSALHNESPDDSRADASAPSAATAGAGARPPDPAHPPSPVACALPRITLDGAADTARVHGDWTLCALTERLDTVRSQLAHAAPAAAWDLGAVQGLDSFGATLLWRAWGGRWPERLQLSVAQRS